MIGENAISGLTEQALTYTRTPHGVSHHIAQSCMERFATAYDREVQNFVDNINRGSAMTGPSSWDGYIVALVCDAGLASLQDGQKYAVTIPPRPALYLS